MNDPSIDERALVLKDSVLEAGKLARQYFEDRQRLAIVLKGPQDLVTEADRDVERLLANRFSSAFPTDGFLSEETGLQAGDGLWVVDPIDGTRKLRAREPAFLRHRSLCGSRGNQTRRDIQSSHGGILFCPARSWSDPEWRAHRCCKYTNTC